MTSMIIPGLVIIFSLALLILFRKISGLNKDISGLRQELFSVRAHVVASIKQIQSPDLFPIIKQKRTTNKNGNHFTLDMNIGEVLAAHPEAQKVLANHHLGACSSCSISDDHKLGEAIAEYGVDEISLMTSLNSLMDNRVA